MYGTHVVDMTTKETYTVVHKNVSGIPVVVMLHVINSFLLFQCLSFSYSLFWSVILSFRRKLAGDFCTVRAHRALRAHRGVRQSRAAPHRSAVPEIRSKVAK